MMNSTVSETNTNMPSALVPVMPQPQVPPQPEPASPPDAAPNHNKWVSPSPEETGQKLLHMLQDVFPMVDEDPEVLSLMQDVTKLIYEYE